MPILSQITGALSNNLKSIGGSKKKTGFKRVLNLSDFNITANVSLVNDDYKKIGYKTVPAQQQMNFGFGSEAQPDNQGYIYFRIDHTNGTQIDGTVRLVVSNAQETTKDVVAELRTENLAGSTTDRNQMVPLPETLAPRLGVAQEDDQLQILFQADAASKTLDYDGTNTKLLIPVTIYQ